MFTDSLAASDELALAAAGNTPAIAEAKVKIGKVDAEILAQPLADCQPACGSATTRLMLCWQCTGGRTSCACARV